MNKIKFLRNKNIKINGTIYKPYTICDLPNRFGCINYKDGQGISEWLKLPSPNKGLIYIAE